MNFETENQIINGIKVYKELNANGKLDIMRATKSKLKHEKFYSILCNKAHDLYAVIVEHNSDTGFLIQQGDEKDQVIFSEENANRVKAILDRRMTSGYTSTLIPVNNEKLLQALYEDRLEATVITNGLSTDVDIIDKENPVICYKIK